MSAEQIAKRFARLFGSDDPEYILQQEIQLQKEIEQYACDKLKERDELLELMANEIRRMQGISCKEDFDILEDLLTRYSNLKAK